LAKKLLIFTDLDGTLLDLRSYSFAGAEEALRVLRELQIPMIIATSKTRREIEFWQQRLGIRDPFIAENGGGIFIPKDSSLPPPEGARDTDGYFVLSRGVPYATIRRIVQDLRQRGFRLRGFGDMSPQEVAQLTHMTEEEAQLAKEREFTEPCLFEGDEEALRVALKERGLTFWRGGHFIHIQGFHDKGQAMEVLEGLYRMKGGDFETVALGDSPNDLPMLQRARWPIIIRRTRGISERAPRIDQLTITQEEGSRGWGKAILELLRRLGYG